MDQSDANSTEIASTPDVNRDRPLRLSQSQLQLLNELQKREEKLGKYYLGALEIFNDGTNQDCLALSAHGFRELIEKLAYLMGAPVTAAGDSLGERVGRLLRSYKKEKGRLGSLCFQGKSRKGGTIAIPVCKLVPLFDQFFETDEQLRPTRRAQSREFLRKVRTVGQPPPDYVEEASIRAFMELKDYFTKISHHRGSAEITEFRENINLLEGFLLDAFTPSPSQNLNSIDELITTGESDD